MISKRIKYICFSFILYFFINIGNTFAMTPQELIQQQKLSEIKKIQQGSFQTNTGSNTWNPLDILNKLKQQSYLLTLDIHLYDYSDYINKKQRNPIILSQEQIKIILGIQDVNWNTKEITSSDFIWWKTNIVVWQSLTGTKWSIYLKNYNPNNKVIQDDSIYYPIDWSSSADTLNQGNEIHVVSTLYLYWTLSNDGLSIQKYENNPKDLQSNKVDTGAIINNTNNILTIEATFPYWLNNDVPTLEIYNDSSLIQSIRWYPKTEYSNTFVLSTSLNDLPENITYYFIIKWKGYKTIWWAIPLGNKISYWNFTQSIIWKELLLDTSNDPIPTPFPWTMIWILFFIDFFIFKRIYWKIKEVINLQDESQYYEDNYDELYKKN